MSSSEWIFKGHDSDVEYKEETDETTGDTIIYARNIYKFRREKKHCITTSEIQLTGGSVNDVVTGTNLYGYQGSKKMKAPSGALTKWVCVQDNNEPLGESLGAYRNVQMWERRTEWEEFDEIEAS
ncbi:hypothetical protein P0Y35_11820 [Kiritimatiellaeota bacterium B1221]|nr:hypothetical protein [Kiritimatiellaeota bacterium B1221]